MARIRTLKPEFFRSRSLAQCSVPARVTFQGLWCEADDHGRGVADARVLKGAIWPLDDDIEWKDVEKHLGELADTDHIRLYEVRSDRYYEVRHWSEHQSAAYRRGNAVHPEPPSENACKEVQAALPDVLELGTGNWEGKGSPPYETDFIGWYENYPRKEHRSKALDAYRARRREGVSAADLVLARDNYIKAKRGTEGTFVMMPKTFLAKDGPWSEYRDGSLSVEAIPDGPKSPAYREWIPGSA